MRKTVLLLTLTATFTTNAQLEVRNNGQIWAGKPTTTSSTVANDNHASMNIFGLDNAHGGYITFGTGNDVTIGEGLSNMMQLRGSEGIYYISDMANMLQSRYVFTYTSASDVFRFNCPISATNYLTSSDARLKTDISSLKDSWESLFDLNAVSYRMTLPDRHVSLRPSAVSRPIR